MAAFFDNAAVPPPAGAERMVSLPSNLTGEVVRELRGQLLDSAADRGVQRIRVDCGAVEVLAPYAMTVLVAASRTARAHGGAVELVAPSPVVAAALDELGLRKVLTVTADPAPRP